MTKGTRGPAPVDVGALIAKALAAAILTIGGSQLAVEALGFEPDLDLYAVVAALSAFLAAAILPDRWSGGIGEERHGGGTVP